MTSSICCSMGTKYTTPIVEIRPRRTSFENRYDLLYDSQPSKVKSTNFKIPGSTGIFSKNKGISSKLVPAFLSKKKYPDNEPTYEDKNYESDFESDVDSTQHNQGKINRLRKAQQQTRRKLELKVSERNAKRIEEERLRKYMELESRHSGTSLPLTSPNDYKMSLTLPTRGRVTKTSPSGPVPSNLRLSKSHDKNLNLAVRREGFRSKSGERSGIPVRQVQNARAQLAQNRNGFNHHLGIRNKSKLSGIRPNLENTLKKEITGNNKWKHREDLHCYPAHITDACTTHQLVSSISENSLHTTREDLPRGILSKSEINLNDVGNLTHNKSSLAQLRVAYEPIDDRQSHARYRFLENNYIKTSNGRINPHVQSNLHNNYRCECLHPLNTSSRIPVPFCQNCSGRVRTKNNKTGVKHSQHTATSVTSFWKPETHSFTRSPARTPRTAPIESVRMRTGSLPKQLKPFPGPQDAFTNTIKLLRSKDWEDQVDGLKNLNRFATFHEELLIQNLKEICIHLITHMKSLRSQVSRAAIQTIAKLFDQLGKEMESNIDNIVSNLLHKTSDTNKFLQQDGNRALDAVVENIPPGKALPCIINEGLIHRNPIVRTTVARLLAYSVELLGPVKSLSGQKDITEKMLPAGAKLAQDGNQCCRKYAKIFFQHLVDQPNFDAALKKYVAVDSIKNIQKLLSNINSENIKCDYLSRNKRGR